MRHSISLRLTFNAMKKIFVKIAAGVAALSLSFTLFSCKGEAGGYTYDTAADFREEEGEIFADVPTGEYRGCVFNVLNAKTGLPSSKMDAESLMGSTLNNAIYKRNRNVETRLNVVIKETRDTPENVYDIACQSAMADEDVYGAVWNSASYMGAMAANGYLVSSDYLSQVATEKPWWNEPVMEELSVDFQKYMLVGDLQLSYYDSHSMVGVNMELVSKINGMYDPYSLVNNGTWTVGKMLEMMTMASGDTDGNGSLTYEDRYGAALDKTAVLPLMFGCNTNMSEKDEYDLPYITCINNEKFYDVYTLITQSMYQRSGNTYIVEDNPEDNMTDISMFKNENALFIVTTVGELEKLRSMDSEFGVLPMPKYSAEQQNYVSLLSGDDASVMGVLVSNRNFLRTSVIIENLAAESYREGGVRDTYVDSVLEFRYVNDTESRKNLKNILASGTFDLCQIYGWGNIPETVVSESVAGSEKLTSTLNQLQREANSEIAEFVRDLIEKD